MKKYSTYYTMQVKTIRVQIVLQLEGCMNSSPSAPPCGQQGNSACSITDAYAKISPNQQPWISGSHVVYTEHWTWSGYPAQEPKVLHKCFVKKNLLKINVITMFWIDQTTFDGKAWQCIMNKRNALYLFINHFWIISLWCVQISII